VTARVELVPAATSVLVAISITPSAVVEEALTEITGVATGPDTRIGAVPVTEVTPPPPPPPPVTQTVPSAQMDKPEEEVITAG
jgi:hypothetical protein